MRGKTENGNLPHVARSSGKIEWYTPRWIIDGVRAVMGGIDLDPASCEEAQTIVCALNYYDEATDGLNQPWEGRVFMNPPYARYMVDLWAAKFVGEWMVGHITEGVVLVNNATETQWFQMLALCSTAMCTLRGRVSFKAPGGVKVKKGLQGQVLLYFGSNVRLFKQIWDKHGQVYLTVGDGLRHEGEEVVRNIRMATRLAA